MTPNILIVDDVAANLVALKALLKRLGRMVNVVEAQSGSEALEKVLEHDFALILTDVQMPDMDGFEMASILQEHEEWNQIPIIFITAAYKDEQNQYRGYETGAVDYISKPIDEHILLSKVRIFLKLYEQRLVIQNINSDLERRVEERTTELQQTQNLAKIGGWQIDPASWQEYLSDPAKKILAGEAAEPEQQAAIQSFFDMMGEETRNYHRHKIKQSMDSFGTQYEFETKVTTVTGSEVSLFVLIKFIYEEDRLVSLNGVIQDVSERHRAQEIIRYLELHDPLTSLPNRNCFQEDIREFLADARVVNEEVAILLMDLDKFKEINDIYGQAVADMVLAEIGKRLGDSLTKGESLYRVGGDEFAVVITDIESLPNVAKQAEEYLSLINQGFPYMSGTINVGASLGVAVFPQDAQDADSLVKAADLAMERSKTIQGSTYNFYNAEMSNAFHSRRDQEVRLSLAIEEEQFILHYQPKIDLKSGNVIGAEALVRWNDPKFGMVPPIDFIPLAEETGQIRGIGRWIIRETCEASARMYQALGWKIPIAMNVSVEQMKCPKLTSYIAETMTQSGVDASQLEIEITETSFLADETDTLKTLAGLKELGLQIALDDFGTGFSSLTHLKSLLATVVKIDRSFIQNILTDEKDALIADMVISVAHKLNMLTIAEGVETKEQIGRLREMGCDTVQGYFYSKPIPEAEFIRWYQTYQSERAVG